MADPEANEAERSPGSTTIAPEVLVTIARLSALSIPGVARMAPVQAGVNRLLRRSAGEGVVIDLDEDRVSVQLYLILKRDVNVREVSRKVQVEVARAIEHMVGMTVQQIDVHIEDIDYEDGSGT